MIHLSLPTLDIEFFKRQIKTEILIVFVIVVVIDVMVYIHFQQTEPDFLFTLLLPFLLYWANDLRPVNMRRLIFLFVFWQKKLIGIFFILHW